MKTATSGRKEQIPTIHLKLRIGRGKNRRWAEPAYDLRKRLKPLWCVVDGIEERHPEGVYYLRIGRKKWQHVGSDAAAALLKQTQEIVRRKAQVAGIALADDDAADGNAKSETRPLGDAVEDYLANVKNQKADKTWDRYQHDTRLFVKNTAAKTLEDITRQHFLDHFTYLRKQTGAQPRTVYNHFQSIGIMLRSYGVDVSALVKRNDVPKYEEPIVDAYDQEDLQKFFNACNEEESLVFEFFLQTGFREQEVVYTCWPDIDVRGGLGDTAADR